MSRFLIKYAIKYQFSPIATLLTEQLENLTKQENILTNLVQIKDILEAQNKREEINYGSGEIPIVDILDSEETTPKEIKYISIDTPKETIDQIIDQIIKQEDLIGIEQTILKLIFDYEQYKHPLTIKEIIRCVAELKN